MYESKASIRSEFEQFQKMFFLLGGVLCAIIGLVGILNFFNAIMTGILARKKRVCSATVGWNDKPPVKADACAGRAVFTLPVLWWWRFFCLWSATIIRRHDGEDVLVLHLSFHHPSGYCDASGVCSARLPDPCGTLSGGKQTEYCGTAREAE